MGERVLSVMHKLDLVGENIVDKNAWGVYLPRGVYLPEGVYLPKVGGVPAQGVYLPGGCLPYSPPMDRQTPVKT